MTNDISKYTKAKLFSEVGKRTDVFARISSVGGERGSADTERDAHGFAVRFYTEEGNWDMVGNNTPMFFIKDAIKFPDMVHVHKRDPRTNLKSAAMLWDFNSRTPETLHKVTMVFSSRGTPDGYRHLDGFGIHTFSLINAAGERVWVKWHFKTKQGTKNLSAEEAERIAGADPDYAQRDMVNAIDRGQFPKWDVSIQVLTEADRVAWEKRTGWDAFNPTYVWPFKDAPRIPVGVLELNRIPDNYHAEVEQAAFSPANIVPGMGFSPDKLLQGRVFAYHDTQLYRVGTNHQHLPVNRARCPIFNQQRDGSMTILDPGAAANYAPVDSAGTRPVGLGHGEPGLPLEGAAGRYDSRGSDDYYTQAGYLFRLLPADEKQNLFKNIAKSLSGAPHETQERQLGHFDRADPAYGAGVRAALAKVAKQ